MTPIRRWLPAVVLALGCSAVIDAQPSDQAHASEQAVKAAYLFNFAQFVRWPEGTVKSGAPFTICVLGRDPFGSVLDATVAKESIDGHRIALKRVATPTSAVGCQIVFFGGIEPSRLAVFVRQLAAMPILTVSDAPDFLARGGMIQFVSVEKRIRFEINLDATEAAGLAPSSELGRVALSVRRAVEQ